MAVTTQLPIEEGGGCAKVAWIDTEGTFRGERIIEIADRFNLDSEAVLDNIIVARTFTHEMMSNALIALAAKMAEARLLASRMRQLTRLVLTLEPKRRDIDTQVSIVCFQSGLQGFNLLLSK